MSRLVTKPVHPDWRRRAPIDAVYQVEYAHIPDTPHGWIAKNPTGWLPLSLDDELLDEGQSTVEKALEVVENHLDRGTRSRSRRAATALARIATDHPETRPVLMHWIRQLTADGKTAAPWSKLPPGWTQESLDKFWESMTGDVKHKVTKCMKEMEGKVTDTGAFCGSLADKVDPGWRSRDRTAARPHFPIIIPRPTPTPLADLPDKLLNAIIEAVIDPEVITKGGELKGGIRRRMQELRGELRRLPAREQQEMFDLYNSGFRYGSDARTAEWKGWTEDMAVKIQTRRRGVEIFENLAAAKRKYPTLDPKRNTKDFTWAMKGKVNGRPAIYFEDWGTNRMMSMASLRSRVAALAREDTELRPHLNSLLTASEREAAVDTEDMYGYIIEHLRNANSEMVKALGWMGQLKKRRAPAHRDSRAARGVVSTLESLQMEYENLLFDFKDPL